MEKIDIIYARQSVDRMDSISIESQIEASEKEVRSKEYKVYNDKGYSGKNTDRPGFQEMLSFIRHGNASRVIVYRLDRISRSVLDFAGLFEEFQKYGVEFVSVNERFDTSTPIGKAMLMIIMIFAQLERETIQQRVVDAYISRSRKGFYMGGRIPYGFTLEDYVIDGKKTQHYVADPEQSKVVMMIYQLYAQPQTSFGDIVRYLHTNGISNTRAKSGYWNRSRISDLIKNSIYVRADMSIYEFFKSHGCELHNDPSDYIGTNGCYLYTDKKGNRKSISLEKHHIVLAPHEGIVPADIWLRARRKCINNEQVAKPIKAKNTWLAGKVKCGKCGYALTIRKSPTKVGRYFICSHHMESCGCEGVGGIYAGEFENFIFEQIKERLKIFETLSSQTVNTVNPKILEINVQIAQIQNEIDALIDKVLSANDTVMVYVNEKVKKLDEKKQALQTELKKLEPTNESQDLNVISNYVDHWDELSFDDKRGVVDILIDVIKATKDDCEIKWKI